MLEHDRLLIHSSEESNWRTPRALYDKLQQEFFFTWDFAADQQSTLCGGTYLGPGSSYGEDALLVNWSALDQPYGFLNPPFSRTLARASRTGRIKDPTTGAWLPHPVDPQKAASYEVESWAKKCWEQSQLGVTVVALLPFAPQTEWYRSYVYGHTEDFRGWSGHAALQERRLPHRVSFLRPDGTSAQNAGVNSVVVVWGPAPGIVGPWQPWSVYWSYL